LNRAAEFVTTRRLFLRKLLPGGVVDLLLSLQAPPDTSRSRCVIEYGKRRRAKGWSYACIVGQPAITLH
jgi:hypothetical protein